MIVVYILTMSTQTINVFLSTNIIHFPPPLYLHQIAAVRSSFYALFIGSWSLFTLLLPSVFLKQANHKRYHGSKQRPDLEKDS